MPADNPVRMTQGVKSMKGQIRSRDRVSELGEVFTPTKVVNQMLDILDKDKSPSVFGGEKYRFFEPTCGNGQFVVQIIRRNMEAYIRNGMDPMGAAALTIDSLWAIDVSQKNIDECRGRAMQEFTNVLYDHGRIMSRKEFFVMEAAVNHHIHVNEMLTALASTEDEAREVSKKTRVSREWYALGKWKPLDFNKTFFSQYIEQGGN